MERNTVTRTFSIGAISGDKAVHSDDFFAARRHSSAGLRALLWANSSAKLFGCSLGSDSQTSQENIYPNILTPDSIPQFTIPNLSVQSSLRSLDNRKDDEECEEGYGSGETESSLSSSVTCSSLSSSSGLIVSDRKAERSVSDPLNQRRFLQRDSSLSSAHTNAHQCLDPASRAALSLPHLTKVTTPYGFVTLSQSPQMASEEALLCQAGLRRFRDDGSVCCPTKAPLTRTGDSHVKVNPSHLSACRQKLSKDSAGSHSKRRLPNTDLETFSATSSSSSVTPSQTDGRFKTRFREIIRKHFSSRSRDRLT